MKNRNRSEINIDPNQPQRNDFLQSVNIAHLKCLNYISCNYFRNILSLQGYKNLLELLLFMNISCISCKLDNKSMVVFLSYIVTYYFPLNCVKVNKIYRKKINTYFMYYH